ncbi:MAG: YaiO family outer membrane beta-barrel protein [Acidobacteria bacterium]|nr:YaiO family outer membrane beta-barrel protein [Acidobacteriota bacterium]
MSLEAWKSRLVNKMEVSGRDPPSPARLKPTGLDAESIGVTSDRARRAGRLVVFALLLTVGGAVPAWAQSQAVRTEARSVAIAGRRAEAVTMLETHLATFPRDADARLLLGVVLSWDGKYDDADRELRRVLEQSPTYNDARVALANVAWWTGRYDVLQELSATGRLQRPYDVEWIMLEARALDGLGRRREARQTVMTLLSRQPGHVQARTLKNRLDTQLRPWTLTMGYGADRFSDGRIPWNEYSTAVSRQTSVGSVIGRVSHAERFGYTDRLFEVDFYPSIRPGTYGFVSYGRAKDDTLFPNYRMAADLYQSLGRGYEASIGFRRLGFSSTTDIYVGTLTKYVGNWMVTGKVFSVPDFDGPQDSLSYHGVVRRYIRGDGESYLTAGYSRGSSREELNDSAELRQLDADTFRAGAEVLVGRTTLAVSGSTSRQERSRNGTLWQHSFGASFSVYF